jgi:C-terminal processing protease CtpA/Prc
VVDPARGEQVAGGIGIRVDDRDGPAVAVVDANTYSSGDLFAAGWVDHDIGPLVTVGQATGGGGANVWTAAQLRDALAGTDHALDALPDGVGYTLAIRRAIRSSRSDGVPIEDLGVSGIPYTMTRADLLQGNRDLLSFCTDLLTNA